MQTHTTTDRNEYLKITTQWITSRGTGLLTAGEIAEVIAYDMAAYDNGDIIPGVALAGVMDFMEWKRKHAFEARELLAVKS